MLKSVLLWNPLGVFTESAYRLSPCPVFFYWGSLSDSNYRQFPYALFSVPIEGRPVRVCDQQLHTLLRQETFNLLTVAIGIEFRSSINNNSNSSVCRSDWDEKTVKFTDPD